MFREPKRSAPEQDRSVNATRYPISRQESRPLALREEKQLFLLQGQDESLVSSGDVPFIPNRYHQNGAAEKVLGAVYTPPRVAAALTRWAVRVPTDRVLDPSCGEGTGRLAMVIPEELLHVGYAEGLRKFLLRRFRRVFVRLPSHEIFSGVQQAVVLLLCENENSAQSGLLSIEYSALEEGDFNDSASAQPWSWNHKWTHLFLAPNERQLLSQWWPRLDWQPVSS